MKTNLLTTGLILIIIFFSCKREEPDYESVLRKSIEKCRSVQNGYYEMEHYMKYMSKKDTVLQVYQCTFSKLPDDTIFPSAFHYRVFSGNEYVKDVLYTGDDFVTYSVKDSTGEIMSKKLWAKDIQAYSHNYTLYPPLVDNSVFPLPKDSAFIDNRHLFEFAGEETVNGNRCYHIIMNTVPENDSADMLKTLRNERHYWINKEDYIPVQYSIAYDLVMNNDTMYQYEKNVLTKYELNNHRDDNELNLNSIPSFVKLEDYKPFKAPELLPAGTAAPDWSLVSLKNETVTLSGLKGKVVLIDFFYKSCYPCLLALPALQELHEKYHAEGLAVIGIDPYDTKEKDDIENFLAKRDVTYTVLLDGKDVAKAYHVSGYPTMYLIDKDGKIIFSQVGYGDGVEEKLEEVIKENI